MKVQGEVWILPAAGGKVPATSGRAMMLSDTVETGATGKVQVELADGSVIELGANSTFEIVEFEYNRTAGEKKLWIQQINGVFRYLTGHGLICTTGNKTLCFEEIQTKKNSAGITAVTAVRGSDVFVRTDLPGERIDIDVHLGLAEVNSYKGSAKKSDVYVDAGHRAVITKQGTVAIVNLSNAEWSADVRST